MEKIKEVVRQILYWFVLLTWGGLLSIPGLIGALICVKFFGGKIYKNGYSFIVEVGGNWGGVNLGCVSFCGNYLEREDGYGDTVRAHEYGHSIQQLIFGPFFIFVIGIPSFIRCQLYNRRVEKGLEVPDYDDIWFEYTASKWGTAEINRIEGKNIVFDYVREK